MCVLEPVMNAGVPPFARRVLLLDNVYNGSVIPNLFEYVLQGSGYLLERGEKRWYLPHVTVTGDLFASLQHVPFIGSDTQTFASDCTKNGQVVRVGYRSPSVMLEEQSFQGGSVELSGPGGAR